MAPEQPTEGSDRLMDRIVALSDGIFAFAMTLLVLGIEVPVLPADYGSNDLLNALLSFLPKLESYIIGFLVLGAYWSGYHRLFNYFRRADHGLAWLNICYLMCIAFMPFPTAVLGSFARTQVAVVLYAATLTIASLITWYIWHYATSGHRLVDSNLEQRVISFNSLLTLLSAAVFVLSIGISFWSPLLAMYSWLLTAAVHPLVDRLYGVGHRSE